LFERFAPNFFLEMTKTDFSLINGNEFIDKKIKDMPSLSFQKSKRGSIYVVNILDVEKPSFSLEVFNNWMAHCEQNFLNMQASQATNAKYLFCVNIFVGRNGTLKNYIDSLKLPQGQSFYSICWQIEDNGGNIYYSENQPDDVEKLNKSIRNALKNPTDNSEKTLNDILSLKPKRHHAKIIKPIPYVTYALIFINILIFALMELNGSSTNLHTLTRFGALNVEHLIIFGEYWRIISSAFVHIGLDHLAGNMLGLYIYGTRVEKYFGTTRFILIYFFATVVGVIVSLILSLFASFAYFTIAAGASGAVFGLVGAVGSYSFKKKTSIEGISFSFTIFYLVYSIAAGFFDSSIGHVAHIVGFLTGLILAFLLVPEDEDDKKEKKILDKTI